APHVNGDLTAQVASGNGRGHLGDVAHLPGQVAGHGIDLVGEVFPGAGHTGHDRLAAELAVGADFARHARYFRGERVELVHHRIDRVLQLQNFALHIYSDLAREVATGDGGRHLRNITDLRREIRGH